MADENGAKSADRKLTGPAVFAASAALIVWAVCVLYMGREAKDATDLFWTRLAFLFASVEAVAFAAGGALWGASIQRERAEKAEAAAASNQKDAESGRALAKTLLADQPAGGHEIELLEAGGDHDVHLAARHARLARTFFPQL